MVLLSNRCVLMEGILHMYVPQLIDALVDDKEVAEEAKSFHKEAMDASRKWIAKNLKQIWPSKVIS